MSLRRAIVFIVHCALGIGSVVSAAQPVFRFRPPDSLTFNVDVKTDRTRWIDSAKYPTDSSISTVRRVIKKDATGYTMTARPVSLMTNVDGKPANNPVNQMLMGITSTSYLDTVGLIDSVAGYDGLAAKIDSLFTGEIAQKLKASLSPANMAAREQLDWNGKLQGLAGSSIDVGKIDYEASQYPLPGGGHIPFLLAIRVADTVTLNRKLCAVLVISAGSDPNELTERLHVESDEIALHFPFQDASGMAVIKAGSSYYSETRVILEIATMLIQTETSHREIAVAAEPGSGPRKMRLVEGEQRRYNYQR